MRVVGQFLLRFWVAALALSILLSVLSVIGVVKLARKTWGCECLASTSPGFTQQRLKSLANASSMGLRSGE